MALTLAWLAGWILHMHHEPLRTPHLYFYYMHLTYPSSNASSFPKATCSSLGSVLGSMIVGVLEAQHESSLILSGCYR